MRGGETTAFAIKAADIAIQDSVIAFQRQKTMYGGKRIETGTVIYLFESRMQEREGLIARGVIADAFPLPRIRGLVRQTPRVDIVVDRIQRYSSARRLNRQELRSFDKWQDGQPETELNFKLYRQATDKIVGLSPSTADFLGSLFGGNAAYCRGSA